MSNNLIKSNLIDEILVIPILLYGGLVGFTSGSISGSSVTPSSNLLLKEDGFYLLLENGNYIQIEQYTPVWVLSSSEGQPVGVTSVWKDESVWLANSVWYD